MLALAAALLTALLTLFAGSASATIVRLANGHAISYQPLLGHEEARLYDEILTNLDYNGGPVMPSNTNYTFYWSPTGRSAYPAGYITGVNRYLEDLAHDSGGDQNVDSVSAQYNDAAGQFASYNSHYGGEIVDEHAFPASGCSSPPKCLTDEQIRAELKRYVKEHGLPMNLATEYFLLLPPGVNSCFEANEKECSAGATVHPTYCAYHSNIAEGSNELLYSNDGYDGEGEALFGCTDGNFPNGISDTALEGGLSHEHNESLTDPEPNSAWTDLGALTGEIGDKCRNKPPEMEFGTPLGKVEREGVKYDYNQLINGDHYWYQQEWSNAGDECLQRLSPIVTEPTATFTAREDSGLTATFNAGASTAPGGVAHYVWQWNDGPGLVRTTETSSPVITHEFSFGSLFTVALTVMSANGTSIGTARQIDAGTENPGAAFSANPGSAVIGNSIGFDASASTSPFGSSISSYSWSFGDGSGASGVTTSHAYGAAGTYEVTLTVTNSFGFSTPVTHSVTITTPPAAPAPAPVPVAVGSGVAPTGKVALPAAISVKSNGHASAKLSCTGTAVTCSGEIVLTVRRTETVHGHKRTRTIVIGTFRFTIPTGAMTTRSFTLKPAGRSLLRAGGGHLKVTETLHLASPSPALTRSQSTRLNLARH